MKLSFGSKPKLTEETRVSAPQQSTLSFTKPTQASKKRGIEDISSASQENVDEKDTNSKRLKVVKDDEEKKGEQSDQ